MEERELVNGELYLEMKEAALRAMDNSRELSDQELQEQIEGQLRKRDKEALLSFMDRKRCADAVFASFRRFGVLQELMDDEGSCQI